ncbi:YidB family protein [uncultured Rhodoblastus sp.]|uniref:YidB family protein n=1 Tax=uncultured Rhodoblastus sp. TaxID=543037 RepID=UPI0025FD82AF|nr:YidB family protein [uncultured Rhodoblastus sp.]
MGQYEDKQAVPGNDFAKPLLIAAGALLLGHLFGGKKDAGAQAPQLPPLEELQKAPGASGGGLASLGGIIGALAASLGSANAGTAVSTGLDSLLNQFRQAGQGKAAESWVGTGENHPISPDQLNAAIGHGKIADIARQAGLSPEQLSQLLAQALPKLIDKLTPGGKIQQG